MKTAPLLVLALLAGASGCAVLNGRRADPDPALHLQQGLTALDRGNYEEAARELGWVYERYPARPEGQHALLALTALELDPRNPHRQLATTADLAAQMLNLPGGPTWTVPVGETFYLVAQELGAEYQRQAMTDSGLTVPTFTVMQPARGAEPAMPEARRLPPLPERPSIPEQLGRLRQERDSLQARADSLEQLLADREKKLRETQKEIERIRKTLRG